MTNKIRRRLLTLAAATAACAAATINVAGAMDLNAFRSANGRASLQVNATLAAMAHSHAADMARRNTLDHSGFMTHRARAGARAENVSYGCDDVACVIGRWSRSPPHRSNMLLPGVRGYGLASAVSSTGRRYWALELGH